MVTTTDDYLEELSDLSVGRSERELHTVKVGSGTGSESSTSDGLASVEYESNKENTDVNFVDDPDGQYVAQIDVSAGGTTASVPADTQITEIGVFSTNPDGSVEKLAHVDNFSAVTIPAGNTERFEIDIDYTDT
jgi:hypothetical protein